MDLDRVFADVPRVGAVDGCTYCYAQSDLDALGGDPALVPRDLVGSFAREVTSHWNADQYGLLWRGLAPRILRLLEELPDPILLKGLSFARFSTWPADEQQAVREALRGMLTRNLTGDLLCAAAHVDSDLGPWLRFVDALPDDEAVAGLARYWANDLAHGGEPSLWWFPEDPAAPIRDWLYSDALWERLRRIGDVDTQIAISDL
ncbi:hypothetical protein FKR81_04665 [Lentzea tibetensis]|uniref:Uncharacterized protein n=1 Tax=Lentzea tibetensis TaxID=2591470 RepID=A0A563EZW8_9PSEU|nr:hypothetical protein [Lentzea tibetensis]TWP53266.1 hypothetical protein FKR81_04665 [Lentzea tibetensis]